jgi:hypothetical protein
MVLATGGQSKSSKVASFPPARFTRMATARRPHWVLQGCCIAVVVARASAVQCDLTGQCEFQALLIGTPQGVCQS